MIDAPTPPRARTPFLDIVAALERALRDRHPYLLLRLGDGEGGVMDDAVAGEPFTEHAVHTYFGTSLLQADLDHFGAELRSVCADADVLGLPTDVQIARTPGYGRVHAALTRWGLPRPDQCVTDANVHWYLQLSGALVQLLSNRPLLGLIGSRDLANRIAAELGIARVLSWRTPGEHAYPGDTGERHWPDAFNRIMAGLEVPEPGTPFLVGAGLLGNIYMRRIKELGGIAIDVGSVLDGWAGVGSRLRIAANPDLYTLEGVRARARRRMEEDLADACRRLDLPRMS